MKISLYFFILCTLLYVFICFMTLYVFFKPCQTHLSLEPNDILDE